MGLLSLHYTHRHIHIAIMVYKINILLSGNSMRQESAGSYLIR